MDHSSFVAPRSGQAHKSELIIPSTGWETNSVKKMDDDKPYGWRKDTNWSRSTSRVVMPLGKRANQSIPIFNMNSLDELFDKPLTISSTTNSSGNLSFEPNLSSSPKVSIDPKTHSGDSLEDKFHKSELNEDTKIVFSESFKSSGSKEHCDDNSVADCSQRPSNDYQSKNGLKLKKTTKISHGEIGKSGLDRKSFNETRKRSFEGDNSNGNFRSGSKFSEGKDSVLKYKKQPHQSISVHKSRSQVRDSDSSINKSYSPHSRDYSSSGSSSPRSVLKYSKKHYYESKKAGESSYRSRRGSKSPRDDYVSSSRTQPDKHHYHRRHDYYDRPHHYDYPYSPVHRTGYNERSSSVYHHSKKVKEHNSSASRSDYRLDDENIGRSHSRDYVYHRSKRHSSTDREYYYSPPEGRHAKKLRTEEEKSRGYTNSPNNNEKSPALCKSLPLTKNCEYSVCKRSRSIDKSNGDFSHDAHRISSPSGRSGDHCVRRDSSESYNNYGDTNLHKLNEFSHNNDTDSKGRVVLPPINVPQHPAANRSYIFNDYGLCDVRNFKIESQISEGTYGIVYKGLDLVKRENVALKFIKFTNSKNLNGFPLSSLREIRTLKSLKHPRIVHLRQIAADKVGDQFYLVLNYVDYDLYQLLHRYKKRFSIGEAKHLMYQLLEAVEFMHDSSFFHRDLKSSNVLVDREERLFLTDFGWAKDYSSIKQNLTPHVVTVGYRAPELIFKAEKYTLAVDIWSVGCIMAEIILGHSLIDSKKIKEQAELFIAFFGAPNEENFGSGYVDLHELPKGNKLNFHNHLEEEFENRLSKSGLDLLKNLLQYNPEKRITASQALKHKWFTEEPLPRAQRIYPEYMNVETQYTPSPDDNVNIDNRINAKKIFWLLGST